MPRILIDCRYLNGRPSGIGEMVLALATYLPPQAPDLEFTFLTNAAAPQPLRSDANVTCLKVTAPANGPGTMWFMPGLVDLDDIDLFHAPANILPAGLTMPTVTTIHDLMWLEHPEWCSPGLLHPVRKAFFAGGIRRALRRSTAIAAISDATATAITRHFPDAAMRTHVTFWGLRGFRSGPAQRGYSSRLRSESRASLHSGCRAIRAIQKSRRSDQGVHRGMQSR